MVRLRTQKHMKKQALLGAPAQPINYYELIGWAGPQGTLIFSNALRSRLPFAIFY